MVEVFYGLNGPATNITPSDISFTNNGGGSWTITITATNDKVTFSSNEIHDIVVLGTNQAYDYTWNGTNYGSPVLET
jgi:hypothetical protein